MKAGWKTVKLNDVCDIVKGRKPNLRATPNKGDLPYLVARYIRGLEDPEYGSATEKGVVTLTEADTVIICDGSNSGEIFTGLNGIMSSTMGKVVKKTEIYDPYLRHFLSSTFELFNGTKTGSAIPHLDKDAFRKLEIPLPPLAEQKRIVALLDEAFAGIDAAKAKAEAKHNLSQELRESYLESLLAAEDDWIDTTVAECAEISTGFAFKSSGFSNLKNDIRLLGGDNIIAGAIRWENIRRWPKADAQNYQGFFLSIDDVVLAMDRPIVNTGLKISMISEEDVPSLLIQRTARMRAKVNVYPQFLYLTLSSKKFISYLSSSQKGVGVPHVSSRQIGSFGMKLPPREEQHRIVRLLSDIDSATKATSHNMALLVNNLHELKSSLLSQAFAGELIA